MISDAGGEYAYLNGAFGAVPAFLFSWMSMLMRKFLKRPCHHCVYGISMCA
jgi:hypothetical protein